MRLLPPDRNLGWTPYAWLIYLSLFVMVPALERASALRWVETAAGLAVFLVLYFLGYWLQGPRLLGPIIGITLLGLLFQPHNAGAGAFFIYAASFAAWAGRPARAALIIAGVVIAFSVEAAFLHMPLQYLVWAPILSVLIGAVNIHAAEVARSNSKLRLAHEEIERLAQIAERERIARDLHDLLGHTLSVIVLKSELASRLADRDPARARDEIRDVERISREALAEVRRAVQGYRAASLAGEIDSAASALETAGVQVTRDIEPIAALPAAQETALALAVREAVTNVIRHAGASACSLGVRREGSVCRLVVEDDGRGGGTDGAGMLGMRERVERLGGRVLRETDAGTRLVVELPLSAEEERA